MAVTPLPTPGSLPGNSHTQKAAAAEERPKVEKIISGTATQKKRSFGAWLSESFSGEDARSVGRFIVTDVLVPAFKNMLSDAVTQGVERKLYGDGRPSSRSRVSPYGFTNYGGVSRPGPSRDVPWRVDEPQTLSRRARTTHDFRDVVIPSRPEAALVIDTLSDMAEKYGVVTVADLYDAVGITSEYTDRQWGWNDLSEARIERVRDGYLIQLPPPGAIR